jgi:hypothetical protein
MHPVPADSPEARTVVVTLSARARPLEPAELPAAPQAGVTDSR